MTFLQIAAAVLILVFPSLSGAADKTFTLAVVPQLPAVEIHAKWAPFAEKISAELGVDIRIKTYSSIPQFEADLLSGAPDFAFMNPYHEVMAKKAQGYIPLVRDKTPLVGIIVARKDKGINSVQDLKDKEIAFPAPNAFAASLYMRALLIEKAKITFVPLYVKTHTNVYLHVLLSKASAGGGVNNTFQREPEDLKNRLKVIYETPGSAPHPLSAHPRVPASLRKRFIKAVLDLAGDKNNKDMFNNIQMPGPAEADYKRDYLPLENLGLEKYVGAGAE